MGMLRFRKRIRYSIYETKLQGSTRMAALMVPALDRTDERVLYRDVPIAQSLPRTEDQKEPLSQLRQVGEIHRFPLHILPEFRIILLLIEEDEDMPEVVAEIIGGGEVILQARRKAFLNKYIPGVGHRESDADLPSLHFYLFLEIAPSIDRVLVEIIPLRSSQVIHIDPPCPESPGGVKAGYGF